MAERSSRKTKTWVIVIIALLGFVALFSAVSLFLVKTLYDSNFPQYDRPQFSGFLTFDDMTNYPYTTVQFESGMNKLTGYIFGEQNDKGLVVISHGSGSGAERYLAEIVYFVDHGWRVFAYDNTGSYTSEGASTVGLSQSLLDLRAALNYVKNNESLRSLPLMLYGHSWGGYAVTAILNENHEISAVASIAGYNTPLGLFYEQGKSQAGFFGTIAYPYEWLYQRLLFGNDAGIAAVDGINSSGTPVMIIHGTADDLILYNGASIMAQKDAITNPNGVYVTRSEAGQDGHSSLLRSREALEYSAAKNQECKAISDSFGGNIPQDVRAAWYAGLDKWKTSELDSGLMDQIGSFFESSLLQ